MIELLMCISFVCTDINFNTVNYKLPRDSELVHMIKYDWKSKVVATEVVRWFKAEHSKVCDVTINY
jgi:hypothetical protein